MIRICCFLLLVAGSLADARPPMCEQRERSIADLDLAEDALNKAKQLVPNCEEDESSNSTECSKKEKSIGFIDAALDLVSNAKKNIPICPHIPTVIPSTTTEDFSFEIEAISPTTEEPLRAMDCQELQEAGIETSGVYQIWPKYRAQPIQVRCDMDTDGGGWTVFQRRGNFSVQENFDRDWNDYKTGFGSLERDFWLGNDNLFALSNQGNYSLRMDMTAVGGEDAFAVYRTFHVTDENFNYMLKVTGYDGTAGDSLTGQNYNMFSTKDRRNNKANYNCAVDWKSGFWYEYCSLCNPNGLYKPGVNYKTSMYYSTFKSRVGLTFIDMKLKRL